MLMPKKHEKLILEYLFSEGVLVAKKDVHLAKHPNIQNVPNLHVMKLLQSLKSKGHVKEQFAWRHHYFYLTNQGLDYLRDYLHLPGEIVPATMKQKPQTDARRPRPAPRQDYREGQGYGDRGEYRKAAEKKGELGPGQEMEFRGGQQSRFSGFGRGAPRQ
ncbi:40S ribosomal protein S10-like [Paramacrobiotus metropolitanus]|uniref:40S ribosomal protein S10-like n=1 Tax=Paramacrobiotus metropolitanus TaxID=2943436 RepID=UPI002445B0BC|nr:40S ribosomal protein S10-like [Paramacrobiotus metropolitanus]